MIASNDRAVSPELQKAEAGGDEGCFDHRSVQHVPMLSHPNEVADLIEQARSESGKSLNP